MSYYWYDNPNILFQDINEFFPKKQYNNIQQVNSIARLSIYYSILIILLKLDKKYLSLSCCLLILSYFLGTTEKFANTTTCTKPTKNNPFMNFTLGDQIKNPNRKSACLLEDVREEEIKSFRNNMFPDVADLYGKTITDRNFYTMPNTTIVNDQNGFANYLFGDFGKCKANGTDCLEHVDNRFARGRYYR